jgi:hypothetical protein
VTAVGHLLWEILQLPLYTLWSESAPGEIAFAVVHCTGGDLVIALVSLTAALVLVGTPRLPSERFRAIAILTVLFGVGYTVYSEWFNVSVRGSWAYAPSMPTIPPLGTGLTPALQWIAIPLAAMSAVRRAAERGLDGAETKPSAQTVRRTARQPVQRTEPLPRNGRRGPPVPARSPWSAPRI